MDISSGAGAGSADEELLEAMSKTVNATADKRVLLKKCRFRETTRDALLGTRLNRMRGTVC